MGRGSTHARGPTASHRVLQLKPRPASTRESRASGPFIRHIAEKRNGHRQHRGHHEANHQQHDLKKNAHKVLSRSHLQLQQRPLRVDSRWSPHWITGSPGDESRAEPSAPPQLQWEPPWVPRWEESEFSLGDLSPFLECSPAPIARGKLIFPEEPTQGRTSTGFPRILGFSSEGAASELEILAKVRRGLFGYGVGPAFPALVGSRSIEVLAVQTHPQICVTAIAAVSAPGLTRGGPVATARVTMGGHGEIAESLGKKKKGINLAVDPLVMGPQDALTRTLRSATEPTEEVSTAPSRARSLCQPLVDTKLLKNV